MWHIGIIILLWWQCLTEFFSLFFHSEGGGRKLNENKLLTSKKARWVAHYCLTLNPNVLWLFVREYPNECLCFYLQNVTLPHSNYSMLMYSVKLPACLKKNTLLDLKSWICDVSVSFRFDPYSKTGFATCRICKSSVHQSGSHYCQGCAYKKGIYSLTLHSIPS